MTDLYNAGARELQDQFDSRRIADRLVEVTVHDTITETDCAFIERMDMFFLATADADGRPQCSYKGGDPGFVRVVDGRTLAFPNYDGNGMYLSMGNLTVNPHVGMLFVDFAGRPPRRIRVNGTASIAKDDPLIEHWPEAQFVVRVAVSEVFPNCPRYIHRMERVERSPYVPREGVETPVPDWKRTAWARDALPRGRTEAE